ncbi:polyphosphate kinase 1 [Pararcticibacter amylolyticus]|uniref:Polyphosphate kinase n=1 Tax=Pararcticibacter amylolyticus TaxID=2173175 RepID=A0A2U2PFY4_9SPHI|nr:polyphosphate kinase 1 [Pararcticibacter amylolyticus]PWG80270.1 polyphosphate kinase 1 [Pararcticibacter amylolyticus]
MSKQKLPLINREISWLYFNERVLQEAADKSVPLIERLRFLAIFSSNLDEFYRVRVPTLGRLANINTKAKELLGYNPKKTLKTIREIVVKLERKFDDLYENEIIRELATEKIFIINEHQLNVKRGEFLRWYFREKLLSTLVPLMLSDDKPFPELKDRAIYFFVRLSNKEKFRYSLMEIPLDSLERFIVLPETNDLRFIILLDDIIRYCLEEIYFIFDYPRLEAYSIQLTRDAELELDRSVSEKFIETLTKSLQKRKKGKPQRLLYDNAMPEDMVAYLVEKLNLGNDSLIPGNRYHNFKDFIDFPNVGRRELEYERPPALRVQNLDLSKSIFSQIARRDYLINLPYQSFDYIIHFLREAAIDPKVTEISITLYRLAQNSRIINALINAVKNGKKVNCLVELKARFDEQNNIYWTNRLEEEGVAVNYGILDYKVHSKICLITRMEKGKPVYYANLATGNYNEKTAKIYGDHSIFTTHKGITKELKKLFRGLEKKIFFNDYKYLIVSPLETRRKVYAMIDTEIRNQKEGKPAGIILKMNSLADEEMIEKIYEAGAGGVNIQMIVRGMCCLVPGIPGLSDTIKVISIVDKYLEHARVWIFTNGGEEKIFLSSADFMTRNLDRRVEVGFPVLDPLVKQEIRDIISIQLQDNTKAREITRHTHNRYKKAGRGKKYRAQIDIYTYLKNKQFN